MWLQKSKEFQEDRIVKKTKFFGITIFKKTTDYKYVGIKILGLPIYRYANYKSPFKFISSAEKYKINDAVNQAKSCNKRVILWIDHCLGGGTEVYSQNQFEALKDKAVVLRLQYFYGYKRYLLFCEKNGNRADFVNISECYDFCREASLDEVVVNSLVGYANTLEMLDFIEKLHSANTEVSFRMHDFQCICPSFNLLDCDGKFCNLQYKDGCEVCLQRKQLGKNSNEDKILRSGAGTVAEWRRCWQRFFDKTAGEVVVFSALIGDILCKVYPSLCNRVKVIPHQTRILPKVKIPRHKAINIAFLGEVSLPQKGGNIIREMCAIINKFENLNLVVIGGFHDAPANIRVTGRYSPDNLPEIMQREQIDIIFISSIWPETFSYTTSEAISMGLPVVCYDFGAQKEKVAAYDYGLILKNIDPEDNLREIKAFVLNLRKKAHA